MPRPETPNTVRQPGPYHVVCLLPRFSTPSHHSSMSTQHLIIPMRGGCLVCPLRSVISDQLHPSQALTDRKEAHRFGNQDTTGGQRCAVSVTDTREHALTRWSDLEHAQGMAEVLSIGVEVALEGLDVPVMPGYWMDVSRDDCGLTVETCFDHGRQDGQAPGRLCCSRLWVVS